MEEELAAALGSSRHPSRRRDGPPPQALSRTPTVARRLMTKLTSLRVITPPPRGRVDQLRRARRAEPSP